MKILAFAASNSSVSINKQLVTHATEVLRSEISPKVEIEIIDLNEFEMPIYSSDREKQNGIPELAKLFFEKVGQADALIISFAEHNGSYTAAYKNVFDWASRINAKVYQDKPAVILSASPGKSGGASVMRTALGAAPFFGMQVVGNQSVASFYDVFNEGALNEVDLSNQLRKVLANLSG